MQRTVHVGEWKVAEPFGKLFLDLCWSEAGAFFLGRSIDFEELFLLPSVLVLFLESSDEVSLARLLYPSTLYVLDRY